MNFKRCFLTGVITVLPLLTFGQITLKGKLTDSIDKPLSGVNIVLIETKDNTISNGTITDEDGNFKFQNVEKGRYKIEFSYLGYASQNREIQLEKDSDLGNIVLREENY